MTKKLPRKYFTFQINKRDLAELMLDGNRAMAGWRTTHRLTRCEMLTSVLWRGDFVVRGILLEKPHRPAQRRKSKERRPALKLVK